MTSPAGGDGGNGGNPGTAGPGTGAPPAPAGTGQPTTGTGQAPAGNAGTGTNGDHGFHGDFDPARARATIDAQRAEVADLRRQLAETRKPNAGTTDAGTAGTTPPADDAAGKAGDDPDAKLAAERTRGDQLAEQARQARLDLAIHQHAGTLGGDPVALVDSLTFKGATKDLDPTAADFGEQLNKAITAALEKNPALRARGQVPGASGADTAGRTGPTGQPRPRKSLAEAISTRYGT